MPHSANYMVYDELVDFLRKAREDHPEFCELELAGKSHEGRYIWALILTNKKTGAHGDKPAIYIDGNQHAGEVTGSAVAVYTIKYLLNNYAKDDAVTRLLDTRTFYIIPRVSVDGAELYLTSPYMLRSSVRPYPDEETGGGLVPEDIDGDGIILQMRWEDPAGQWKISEKDPRIMARRKPGERGGRYFRMMSEGRFRYFDGVEIKQARPKWGLDINRNYPGNWRPASEQTGPGPYPFSEPESRTVGDFIHRHPNIAVALSYHTYGGYILRARTAGPDKSMPRLDLLAYLATGRQGQAITGYPCVSIFEGFTVDQAKPSTGSFLDFTYDIRGIMTYAVELWDLQGRAGIAKKSLKERIFQGEDQAEDDEVAVMAYIDKELGGEGFHAWKLFEHPQLGPVEIGGLHPKFMRQNPPLSLLEEECHKNCLFSLMLAETTPEITISQPEIKMTAPGEFDFSCTLKNEGYLPTSGSQQAQAVKAVKPIKIKIDLQPGVSLFSGKTYEEVPHLAGWSSSGFGLERKIRFVIKTEEGWAGDKLGVLKVETQRAGTATLAISAP